MPATLDDLIAGLPQNMSNQILTPEQQQARVQQSVAAATPEMLRQYGQTGQQQAESDFGRGMGLSTYAAYKQALNTMMQNEAGAKIQNDAQNAVNQAQQAAIGNAASYATSERNRASQAGMNTENNAARAAMQRQAARAQGSAQNKNMLFQGLGGLASGGAGMVTKSLGPEIQGGIKGGYNKLAGLFGGPKTEQAPDMAALRAGAADEAKAYEYPPAPSYGDGGGGGFELPSYDFAPQMGDGGGGYDFNMPEIDWGGGADMSLDQLLNSSQNSNWWENY